MDSRVRSVAGAQYTIDIQQILVPFTSLLTHIINSLLAEKRVAKFRRFVRPCGLVGSVAGPGSEPAQLAL